MGIERMNSRERVWRSLSHREPDRVPFDMGGSDLTGMHASTVYRLRQALGLDAPGTPVKVMDPYMMLGEFGSDLMDALDVDVALLPPMRTMFGFAKENWKPWALGDGTPVLVPDGFNTTPEPNGDLLMYPGGDHSSPPSGRLPKGGFYFDAIVRQPSIDEDHLDPRDNTEEFIAISEEELSYYVSLARRLNAESDRAIFAEFSFTGFGDIALVPAPWMKSPKGIRDIEEWYISLVARKDYVYKVFETQCEIALANLGRLAGAIGTIPMVVLITGTDFGAQDAQFVSLKLYRDLFKPFHREVNSWLHAHTSWKTFIHSCGAVSALIPDFIDAGFDILNPIQTSATGMDPSKLKERFGERIALWGGGIDTQRTLPFGTPQDVKREVCERMRVFGGGGGYVFSAVHNIQAGISVGNLLAMVEAVKESR